MANLLIWWRQRTPSEQRLLLGLTGLLGSGRSELARTIYGADRAQTGTLKIKGKKVEIKHPIDAMNMGMGMLPDDRKAEGIVGDLSVRENIILAMQAKRGIMDLIPMKEQEEIADKFIDLLQIKTASRETPVKQLSGGNQQKVIIARWLATDPDFLILDEPTNGLHIKNVRSLLKLLNQMVDEGNSIFVIEHNIEFIKSADYVVELGPEGGDAGGRLLFAGTPSEMKMSEKSVTAEYL